MFGYLVVQDNIWDIWPQDCWVIFAEAAPYFSVEDAECVYFYFYYCDLRTLDTLSKDIWIQGQGNQCKTLGVKVESPEKVLRKL